MSTDLAEYVWQDRELRFDSPEAHLQCRSGEKIIDSINSVEDTKGGPPVELIYADKRIIFLHHCMRFISYLKSFTALRKQRRERGSNSDQFANHLDITRALKDKSE